MFSIGKTSAAVCSWPVDAEAVAAVEAVVAAEVAAASAVAAAGSDLLAAVVAVASVVAVAAAVADLVGSGSVPAWAWSLAWLAQWAAGTAAPGERAACAKSDEKRRCSLGGLRI